MAEQVECQKDTLELPKNNSFNDSSDTVDLFFDLRNCPTEVLVKYPESFNSIKKLRSTPGLFVP